jgi:hypothetical protein
MCQAAISIAGAGDRCVVLYATMEMPDAFLGERHAKSGFNKLSLIRVVCMRNRGSRTALCSVSRGTLARAAGQAVSTQHPWVRPCTRE